MNNRYLQPDKSFKKACQNMNLKAVSLKDHPMVILMAHQEAKDMLLVAQLAMGELKIEHHTPQGNFIN